jgi:hypothetical protein
MEPDQEIEQILRKPTCSVPEYGRIVNISRNGAYESVRRGEVDVMRVGNVIRVLTVPLRKRLGM